MPTKKKKSLVGYIDKRDRTLPLRYQGLILLPDVVYSSVYDKKDLVKVRITIEEI